MTRGSSPRVRGKRHRLDPQAHAQGLIPARAGKTPRTTPSNPRSRAHPRACGENNSSRKARAAREGSSPRVRGKRVHDVRGRVLTGLIPARAGKTTPMTAWTVAGRAHPRACGENTQMARTKKTVRGSSPRVRGKRRHPYRRQRDCRLIPARAGKTGALVRAPSDCRAHPRACGENLYSRPRRRRTGGSSPRVRGKRLEHARMRHSAGLIPARAGKTRSP